VLKTRVLKICNRLFLLLFLGIAGIGLGHAQTIEAEGTAPINGSAGVAKRLAIQDAIRQALFQASAQVTTTTVVSSRGVVSDNVRFKAAGRVNNVSVLDEWTDEANYYVKIRAEVPGEGGMVLPANVQSHGTAGMGATRLNPGGRMDAAQRYRRKVAISQFHVLDRSQIHDLPNFESEMARELKRRLDADGRIITIDASQYLLPVGEEGIISQQRLVGALPPAQEPAQVAVEFADSLGAQFILSGVIRDMGVTKHLFGAQIRHLELDIIIYDGLSGTEVARHRISDSVEDGAFSFATTAPVMNDKFFASPIGQKVNQALDKMTQLVAGDVSSQPFTARVIRASGTEIYIDAGGVANVQVGDVLNAYQLAQAPLADLPGQRSLGFSETPTATLVVKQVQRQFAIGELDSVTARLAVGDVIRFDQ
jgi:hypothetical protein